MSTRGSKKKGVSSEEIRLKKIFGRILVASILAPVAAAGACSSSSNETSAIDSQDATIGNDGSAAVVDAGGGPVTDAQVICAPTSIYVDANLPDGAIDCDIYNQFSCTIPIVPYDDCTFPINDCPTVCPGVYFFNCRAYGNWCLDGSVLTSADGGITLGDGSVVALDPQIVECATCPNGAGRRPRGLAIPIQTRRSVTALGRYFADVAHLEKASVRAFRLLKSDLVKLGAPRELARSADRAARDEVRHARATARIARRHGGSPPEVIVRRDVTSRSIEELALENAVEGCVRETFGALVASWQAAHAEDEAIARAMRSIAVDETRHAALSWAIAKWAENKLDRDSRCRIASAVKQTISDLEAAAACETHPDVERRAGVPNAKTHRAMLRELRATLWA